MAKYEYLILDVDDTLLNFEKCELNAFLRTMEACKIVPEERLQKLFIEICDEVWLKYDLEYTNKADIHKKLSQILPQLCSRTICPSGRENQNGNAAGTTERTVFSEV